MLATAMFIVGLILMGLALLVALVPTPPERPSWQWLYALGLLLAVGSHGWPGGL